MNYLILLSWFLLACISFVWAKERQRNPYLWFFLGFLGGIFTLAFLYFLKPLKKASLPPILKPIPTHLSDKLWFYLQEEGKASNSMSFFALKDLWNKKVVSSTTYVWHEQMTEWKKIKELPELLNSLK